VRGTKLFVFYKTEESGNKGGGGKGISEGSQIAYRKDGGNVGALTRMLAPQGRGNLRRK